VREEAMHRASRQPIGGMRIVSADGATTRDDWDSQYLSWEEMMRRASVYTRKSGQSGPSERRSAEPSGRGISPTLKTLRYLYLSQQNTLSPPPSPQSSV
jgi:hypothetical protein